MNIYYHSKDLDGWCCGAILKKKYPDANFIGYDYGQPFEMPIGVDVIMADVSLPMRTMAKVAQASKSFIWVDHHASAIKDFNEYFKGKAPFTAVLQDGISACEGVWNYFFPDGDMPEGVRLLGQYDTWRNSDRDKWENEILPFQYGMRNICNSLDTFPMRLVDDIFNEDFIQQTIESGCVILEYQAKQDEYLCRTAFEMEFKGLRAICVNGGRNSQTFKSVYDESKHDIMMPFNFTGRDWRFSLYTTKEEVDCSKIAKTMGGGGHKKAAGFKVNDIRKIFPHL